MDNTPILNMGGIPFREEDLSPSEVTRSDEPSKLREERAYPTLLHCATDYQLREERGSKTMKTHRRE